MIILTGRYLVKDKLNYKIIGVIAVIFVGLGIPPAMADDPEDRVLKILEDGTVGGTVGLYLQEVNGLVLADRN